MERVRKEAVAHATESAQQRSRLRLAEGEDPSEHRVGVGGATLLQPAQPAAQAVDVEVQDGGGEPSSAARPGGAQPAQERPLLEVRRFERGQAILQEADEDVEVARRADRARQLAQHPQDPGEPAAPVAADQQPQRDAQASGGDPKLVDRLLVPGEGARQLLEDTPHSLAQQRGGPILGKRVGCHGNITAST